MKEMKSTLPTCQAKNHSTKRTPLFLPIDLCKIFRYVNWITCKQQTMKMPMSEQDLYVEPPRQRILAKPSQAKLAAKFVSFDSEQIDLCKSKQI